MADNLTVNSAGAGKASVPAADLPKTDAADNGDAQLARLKQLAKARSGKLLSDKQLEALVKRHRAKTAHRRRLSETKEAFESSQSKETLSAKGKAVEARTAQTTGAKGARSVKDGLTPEERESVRSDPKAGPKLPPTQSEPATPEQAKQLLSSILDNVLLDGQAFDLETYSQSLKKRPPTGPKGQQPAERQSTRRDQAARPGRAAQSAAAAAEEEAPAAETQTAAGAEHAAGAQQGKATQQGQRSTRSTQSRSPARGSATETEAQSDASAAGETTGHSTASADSQAAGFRSAAGKSSASPRGSVPQRGGTGRGAASARPGMRGKSTLGPQPMPFGKSASGMAATGSAAAFVAPSVRLSMKSSREVALNDTGVDGSEFFNAGGGVDSHSSFDGMHFNWDGFFALFLIHSQKDLGVWRRMMRQLEDLEDETELAAHDVQMEIARMRNEFERFQALSSMLDAGQKLKDELAKSPARKLSGAGPSLDQAHPYARALKNQQAMVHDIAKAQQLLKKSGTQISPKIVDGQSVLSQKQLAALEKSGNPELQAVAQQYKQHFEHVKTLGGRFMQLGLLQQELAHLREPPKDGEGGRSPPDTSGLVKELQTELASAQHDVEQHMPEMRSDYAQWRELAGNRQAMNKEYEALGQHINALNAQLQHKPPPANAAELTAERDRTIREHDTLLWSMASTDDLMTRYRPVSAKGNQALETQLENADNAVATATATRNNSQAYKDLQAFMKKNDINEEHPPPADSSLGKKYNIDVANAHDVNQKLHNARDLREHLRGMVSPSLLEAHHNKAKIDSEVTQFRNKYKIPKDGTADDKHVPPDQKAHFQDLLDQQKQAKKAIDDAGPMTEAGVPKASDAPPQSHAAPHDHVTHDVRYRVLPPESETDPKKIKQYLRASTDAGTKFANADSDFKDPLKKGILPYVAGGIQALSDVGSQVANDQTIKEDVDKAVQGAMNVAKENSKQTDALLRQHMAQAQGMINQLIQLLGMSRSR